MDRYEARFAWAVKAADIVHRHFTPMTIMEHLIIIHWAWLKNGVYPVFAGQILPD
jgi:uncharacterized membrane protein (DUF106 family)